MQKIKIAVLVSGGGTNLQALIDEIEKGNINGEIVLVLSDRDSVYALERAAKHNIKAVTVNRKSFSEKEAFNNAMLEELKLVKAELIVLGGFLSIFTSNFVKEYEGRILNIHPALIPAFCGKGFYGERVHQAAIDYGVKVSGATVHFVDEGTDSGPIILQETVAVDSEDTVKTLAAKVLKLEHRLLPEAVRLYCDGKLRIEGRRVRVE